MGKITAKKTISRYRGIWIILICLFVTSSSQAQDFGSLQEEIVAVAYSPDGQYLAVAGGAFRCISPDSEEDISQFAIRILDTTTMENITTLVGHRCQVNTIEWSPNGEYIASAAMDGSSRVWNIETAQRLSGPIAIFDIPVRGIMWSPNGNLIADFFPNGHSDIRIWDAMTGDIITRLELGAAQNRINAIVWSPDGSIVVQANSDGFLHMWNVANLSTTGEWQLMNSYPNRPAASLAWAPDGNSIALGGIDITIIDSNTGNILQTLAGHERVVTSISWNPTENLLASGSLDGTVRIWDIQTSELVSTFTPGGAVWAVAWNPDGGKLSFGGNLSNEVKTIQFPTADAGPDQTLTDRDSSGSELVTLDGSGSSDSDGTIVSYEWSEDGAVIATGITPQVDLAVGEHTITLTVTDDDGATGGDVVVITVEALSITCDFTIATGDSAGLVAAINTANPSTHGLLVVGWGPPETCRTAVTIAWHFPPITSHLPLLVQMYLMSPTSPVPNSRYLALSIGKVLTTEQRIGLRISQLCGLWFNTPCVIDGHHPTAKV